MPPRLPRPIQTRRAAGWIGLLALLAGLVVTARAQEVEAAAAPPKSPLAALLDSIEVARGELEKARAEWGAAEGTAAKAEAESELAAAQARLAELEADFQSIATGVDVGGFGQRQAGQFDLAQEAQELLQPLVEELKQATERPRAIEALRGELEHWERQRDTAAAALANLDKAMLEAGSDVDLLGELRGVRTRWAEHARNAENRVNTLRFQLDESLAQKKSIIDTATSGFAKFFRSRGKNLLVTVLAFFAALLGLRWLGQKLRRFSPWHRPGKRSFYSRLVEVCYGAFTFVGAALASLLVLYATGDWLLMGLSIVFLFGLVLAARGALPRFYEQARLLLNLGEVREGERVVIDGVPWRVRRLAMFTTLENPALDGGTLRLPVRSLAELRSRPFDDKEPWFPSREGEWVLLADGTRGKVVQQTPEQVHLVLLGGSRKFYTAPDYIAAAPTVLSRGFRVRSVFGIDYAHQAIATTEVPELIAGAVTRELLNFVERDQIGRIKVEFRAAGASSLDYEIVADMKGEVADKFEVISRALQKASVDACNEHGWTIPFTQVTVHPAAAAAAAVPECAGAGAGAGGGDETSSGGGAA